MANKGNLNICGLIEDDGSSSDESDEAYKEWEFKGDEARKMVHFFIKSDLRTMVEKYSCHLQRDPSQGCVKTLKMKCKRKYMKDVEMHIIKIRLEISKLDTVQISFKRENSPKLSEFLGSPERLEDTVCYIPDIAGSTVEIIGKSYDEVKKAEHKLQVYLGEIKATGTRRIGRQISDPGNSLDPLSNRSMTKTYSEAVGSSSFKKISSQNGKFAQSYSGIGSSRHALPSANDIIFETKLKNDFVLKVYKASITNLDVDVIVNAANDIMMHGGGVARVISRAAGFSLDEESAKHVRLHGNLKVAENIVTTAGNLQHYRAVIHAVGPIWHDYRNKTECLDALGDCIYNILETCSKQKFRTVAMPAISAGIFAVPKELCADMYVDAAARFSKSLQPGDCPRELHFVDIDTSILKYVELSAKKWINDPQSVNPRVMVPKFLEANPHLAGNTRSNQDANLRSHRGYRGQGHGGGEQRSKQGQVDDRNNSVSQSLSGPALNDVVIGKSKYDLKNALKRKEDEIFRWGGKAQVYEMGKKLTVKIFKGEVSKVQNMDAVVCCMDKSFSTTGFVSMALETAGGKDYVKNFKKMKRKYKTFAQKGSVFKCKAGNLGVHHVMHVVMDKILDATQEETRHYNELIFMILNKADEWNYSKLVMPLFGTGYIQYNADKIKACCIAVLKGIDDNLAESLKKGKVTDIHLVNNDELVCKTMLEVFNEGVNTPSANGNSSYHESGRGYSYGKPAENRSNSSRYDRHTGRTTFENSGSRRTSGRTSPQEVASSLGYPGGAAANAPHPEVSESGSVDNSDGDTDTRMSAPPKPEPKRTGNLMIIEN